MEKTIKIEMSKCPLEHISQVAAVLDEVRELLISNDDETPAKAHLETLRWLRDSFNDEAVANGERPYYMTDTKHSVWNL